MKIFAIAIVLLLAALPAHAQRANGKIDCKATGKDFVYDCTIRLTQAGVDVGCVVGGDVFLPSQLLQLLQHLPSLTELAGQPVGFPQLGQVESIGGDQHDRPLQLRQALFHQAILQIRPS